MVAINEEQLQRNTVYDFLRFIGIICIILAHMDLPTILFQIRNFDVPFLIILSGLAYTEFSAIHYTSYLNYIKKRFLRLIIPTWIFLTIYYLSFYTSDQINIKDILFSYALLGHENIGIWIIRIFFSMALLAPMIFWLNKKLETNLKFYFFLTGILILYILLIFISKSYLQNMNLTVFNVLFMYTISYGLLYLYGIRISTFSSRTLKKHLFFMIFIFLLYIIYYWIQDNTIYTTQKFKYPPEGYYFSYALIVSIFLFYLSKYTNIFNRVSKNKFIIFVGSSTFWIYLWHWYFLKLYYIYNFNFNYITKFVVIFIITVFLVYLQNKFLFYILSEFHLGKLMKKRLVTVFTG